MNFQRLAKKLTGLGPPSPTASGTGSFGGGSKAIYGLTGVLATTQLTRGATVSGTGIAVGSRVEEILNDATIIVDTPTTAPGLSVAITFDEIFPYGSVSTDGTSIFLSGKDHRPIDIGMPIGVILAWHPRLFSAASNVGVDTTDRTTLPSNFRLCDGSDITATGSPLISGGFNRLPDLTDNRFLMGGISTSLLGDNFIYGGTNHAGPPLSNDNNGNNSITVSTQSLPIHVHDQGTLEASGSASVNIGFTDLSHGHTMNRAAGVDGGNFPNNISGTSDSNTAFGWNVNAVGLNHNHSASGTFTAATVSGDTGDGAFTNNPISVLPTYLLVKYIMRIK